MSAESRLAELKLELPPAPKPVGVYKPIVIVGNIAYVSGHGPLKSDKTMYSGRVGADVDLAGGQKSARQTGLAILATLREALGSLDHVVQCTVMLADMKIRCPCLSSSRPTPCLAMTGMSGSTKP